MLTRRFLVATLLLVVGLAVLSVRSTGADDKAVVDTARRQKGVAQKALEYIAAAEAAGRIGDYSRGIPKWSKRLVDATRESGAPKAELLEALKQHASLMDARAQRLAASLKAGSGNITFIDVWDAEYEALEARALLEAEQGK